MSLTPHLSRRKFMQQAAIAAASAVAAPQIGFACAGPAVHKTATLDMTLTLEPSALVTASPLLMEHLRHGAPLEEMERWAQGAADLKETFSKIPFYAKRGAEWSPDYWVDFFTSRINTWPPDHFSDEAIARDQAKVTEEDVVWVEQLDQGRIFKGSLTPEENNRLWRVSIATRGYTRPIFGRMFRHTRAPTPPEEGN